MLISLLLLGAGQYLFTKYKVGTLINRLYQVKYVDKVEIERDVDKTNVYIKFKISMILKRLILIFTI